jgi:hypothetical protein
LGFSFKYPADAWTESSPVPEDTNAIVNLVSDEKIGDGVEPIVYYIRVSKSNKSSTQGYTDLQQVNGFSKGFSVYKTEQVLSRSGMLTYLFTKDNNVFIQFSIDPYNSASPFTKQGVYVPVFNQILSTFKFTGQTISGVKEGCIKLMDNPLAWDEANKTCNDVAGKNLELQNFCTENHGKYVDYANAACSFN